MKSETDNNNFETEQAIRNNPFRIKTPYRLLNSFLESVLGLSRLAQIYDKRDLKSTPLEFLDYTLNSIGVTLSVSDPHNTFNNIPEEGSLLVVSNHPLGGLEGVALAKLMLEKRPDTLVLTNELLTKIDKLAPVFVGVDVLAGKGGIGNLKGLRKISRHLSKGGCVLVFPAGKVATFDINQRRVRDHEWNRIVAHLQQKSNAVSLPIYINGYNSKLFYFLSLIHPKLRLLMLPRELSNKKNFHLEIIVGQLVQPRDLRFLDSPKAITDYLRLMTEVLKPDSDKKHYKGVSFAPLKQLENKIVEQNQQKLTELDDYLLFESSSFSVYCAPFDSLGKELVDAIGHAREITFRSAGEGTGNETDIDKFDPHYLHLFVWDNEKSCIVGGYRIGKVDEIVKQHGIDALYGRTLYDFDESYLKRVGKALEMGRSFVHPDYQRKPQALDLLWRGIGAYVAKNPEYHTLFGAVSISNEHSDKARALIAETMLHSFRAEQQFLEDVRPVQPLKVGGRVWTEDVLASLTHISLINKLVGHCDPGKTLPTLLRHYLSLNGRFVCFSVNRVFNDSLDGLIIVDLRKTPKKYLSRYLGKEGSESFLAYWNVESEADKPISANNMAQS